MVPRRRLSLQLTPLLDLLLIVIFAQYMEVQQNTVSMEENFARRERELVEFRELLIDRQEQMQEERSKWLATQRRQVETVGDALAEALNLPGQLVRELTRLREEGEATDVQRLRRAAQRVRKLMEARGEEFVQMVLRVDEMQKHVSLWELHLQANGRVLLSDGQQTAVVAFETREEFLDRVVAATKSFSEPKTLVLLLLSYGDTQAGFRSLAEGGMTELAAQLRHDSGGIRWYDYSLLGYRPEGPILAAPEP